VLLLVAEVQAQQVVMPRKEVTHQFLEQQHQLVVDLDQLRAMVVMGVQVVVQEMELLQLQVVDQEHQVKEAMAVDNQRRVVLAVAVVAVVQHLQVQRVLLNLEYPVVETVALVQHLLTLVLQ
jgi:predicted DCC family thiol-disulfide oxidoreductase YuxK